MRYSGFALIFVAVLASAQLSIQGPQALYDGQNVTSVDLIGNPHRDMQPLRALVAQKAGQPYSQSQVKASIAALQNTGLFADVKVSVVPDLSGLRLDFLLEPAYYIGIIQFPGIVKGFTYTRLLQVVDLPEEDPYDKTRVTKATKSLLDFLHHNGYFQATVDTKTEIDDPHQLVNLQFSVTPGKRARVRKITIQGPSAAETARLLRSMRSLRARLTGGLLKPGESYTASRIDSATGLMRRTLTHEHRLASQIEENSPDYHAEDNRVDVSFDVKVGPLVSVQTTGARLSFWPFLAGREKKKLIPIYSEGTIDRDLVQEGQENIVDYFQKKGYFDVKVNTNFQRKPDRILLVYDIVKGKRRKVDHIIFEGNTRLDAKDLTHAVVVKKAHLWSHGSISQRLLQESAKNLQALYRDHGYEDAEVASRTVEHGSAIDAVFSVKEGGQTVVQNVTVTGNEHIPSGDLTAGKGFHLRPGAPFSPRGLSDDRNRISATYLNHGYLNVEVKTDVTRDSQDSSRVNVNYGVIEHQMVQISDVIYLGEKHTRVSLIKKTAQIQPEAPMKRGDLLEAESRLYDLNIFDWSNVGPRKPITNQTDEAALVKVHESKRNEITYGFGFEISHRGGNVPSGTVAVPGGPPVQLGGNQIAPSQATFASPRGSVEYDRRNMRGLGETASASILLSRLDQRALATYTQPHFIGSQWSSLTSFSIERTTENPLFAAGLGDASFQVERVISKRHNTRLQVRYDFNKTILSQLLVPELVAPRDRNVHLSTFSGALLVDTRDKPLDAHHGIFSTLDLGVTPTVLGSTATFAKLTGQFAFYKPVHSIVFADSLRLGLVKAFAGSFVPTSQLYFSGGGNSLRGFPIDEAGPQRLVPFCDVLSQQTGCVNVTVPVGGRQLFILNSEMRFPLHILKPLGGVVFYDGGNVYSAINFHDFVNNYTNTIGVGLRYSTPVGPIRFDIGRNLNPVTGISATQYYITLGQAF